MNRAERRRHDRAQRKQPVIVVGDNMVAYGLGETYEAKPGAQLPAKVPGEHRWIAIASFVVPVPGSMIGRDDVRKVLGPHNMFHAAIGCYDCEQPWSEGIGSCTHPGDEQ